MIPAIQFARYGGYRCILIDPPWYERGGGKSKRGADKHYPLIKTKDMPRIILDSRMFLPSPCGCHLWLCATNRFLLDAGWLMKQLGFRYLTNMCWPKKHFGLGYWLRGQHELILLGSRGPTLPRQTTRAPGLLPPENTKRHSQKPESMYQHIEQVSPGPRLEMFARNRRKGWDSHGNEI